MGRLSGGLIVTEVAVSCVLLVLAGLFIKSVMQLSTIDLNYSTNNIYTAQIRLPELGYPDTASRLGFYEELLTELETVPGVETATLSNSLPPYRVGAWAYEVEGETYERDEDYPVVRRGIITPDYFRTFGTPILQGRGFSASDRHDTSPVALVNEAFARAYLPDGEALWQRIREGRDDTTERWLTVVGVVSDLKALPMEAEGVSSEAQNPACVYIPMAQSEMGDFAVMALRTQGSPTALAPGVRGVVASIDPELPVSRELPMEGVLLRMTWIYPLFSTLFMAFGIGALFLAAVGLYGVVSFAVTQRTHEMGVRMALGAESRRLVVLVMKKGIVQIGLGLGIGFLLSLSLGGPMQILLFEVAPRDSAVVGLVVLTLACVGLLASLVPARRVTRVDPARALSSE
jgi:predicted permease